jgi:DNA-binding transcriptional regulator YdaS (Cro superfamily)
MEKSALEQAIEIVGGRKALADAIGCTRIHVGLMVTGKTPVTAENALRIQMATKNRVLAEDLRPDLPWRITRAKKRI